ncbi:phospholipase D-like domain-containing protein [Microcoleus sp. B5-C4]
MKSELKLHSPKSHKAIAPRLKELIKNAECLKMAVAFWTIDQHYFPSNSLIQLLKKEGSFACIDIALPTDVTKVCDFARHNAGMYFYLQSVDEGKKKPAYMQDHLLHSKILIFDLPEEKASIFIGSHNWTNRALSGINIETSIEIELDRKNGVYCQVNSLLETIKDECHKVNPDLEKIYKNIQRKENTCLYLHSSLNNDIQNNKDIYFHILHFDLTRKNDFPIDRQIILFLPKKLEEKEGYLLEGKVIKAGLLPKLSSGSNWPNLEEGYWCLEDYPNSSYTEFKHISSLQAQDKNDAGFYATIFIEQRNIKKIKDIDSEISKHYK